MRLGMIGLGRMGANMAQRLMQGGHRLVGFDPKPEARSDLEAKGAATADSLVALVAKLAAPRVVWLMVPAGEITDGTLANLLPLLVAGDAVVDGGNSNYKGHAVPREGVREPEDRLRRLRDERRHLGARRGPQHDDRRQRRSGQGEAKRDAVMRWRTGADIAARSIRPASGVDVLVPSALLHDGPAGKVEP